MFDGSELFLVLNVSFNDIGTPAAKMKKVQSKVVKQRSRELTCVFEAFAPYTGMEGREERIWITEIATDGVHLVSPSLSHIYAHQLKSKSNSNLFGC